jgi:hypothetical protein
MAHPLFSTENRVNHEIVRGSRHAKRLPPAASFIGAGDEWVFRGHSSPDWHETRWGIVRGHLWQTTNKKSAPTRPATVPRQKTASSAARCAKATKADQTLFAAAIIRGAKPPPESGSVVTGDQTGPHGRTPENKSADV